MIKKALCHAFFILICTAQTNLFCTFKFADRSSVFKLSGANASLSLADPVNDFEGTLDIENPTASSLTRTAAPNVINFKRGALKRGDKKIDFTGQYDPDSAGNFKLDGNKTFDTNAGGIAESLSVSGTGNKITGSPDLSDDITLADAATEVDLGLVSALNQNVNLNGGKVTLTNHLDLKDNVKFNGNGIIDINDLSLTLSGGRGNPWTGNINFQYANDISVKEYTELTGTWYFDRGNDSALFGRGHVLDISGGGTIRVDSKHILYIANVHLKGLGSSGGDFDFDSATTSEIHFSNTTVELDGSYTLGNGHIVFDGDGCKIISKNVAHKFVVGNGGVVDVDGVVVTYEGLSGAELTSSPFETTGSGAVNYLNGGKVRSALVPTTGSGGGTGSNSGDIPVEGAGETSSDLNVVLTSNSSMSFNNTTPLAPKAMTYNANGNTISFYDGAGTPMTVQENVTLNIKNTRIENFDPAKINFQGSGGTAGKITFDDDSTVVVNKNIDLGSVPLEFIGNATIDCQGNSLKASSSGSIKVTGAKTLKIKGTKLELGAADAMQCLTADAKIELEKTEIVMQSPGVTFNTGNLDISDSVTISGKDQTGAEGPSVFSFDSKGVLAVKSGSTLKIAKGATFKYNADPVDDGGDATVSKRHMSLADPTAKLSLSGCTFESGATGVALDHGTLLIKGKVNLVIDPTPGAEFEIGSALNVEVPPGSMLDADGPIKYVATTYP